MTCHPTTCSSPTSPATSRRSSTSTSRAPRSSPPRSREYIITGGWPESHPNHRRVPDGIHEQYVRLLSGIAAELDKTGRARAADALDLRLLRLGQVELRQAARAGARRRGAAGRHVAGRGLAAAATPRRRRAELREAWAALRQKIDPIAVVFDIGGVARDNEHIHAVAVAPGAEAPRLLHHRAPGRRLRAEPRARRRVGRASSRWPSRRSGEPWDEVKDRRSPRRTSPW